MGARTAGRRVCFILFTLESSGLMGQREGEKTKWVQIPPQELQATADALSPPRPKHQHGRGHSRQHSTTNNNNRQNTSQSGSQTNSTNNASASGSRIQSRVQSRSGSVQSSPKIGGGRGRKLPADEITQVQTSGMYPPGVGGYHPPPLPPPQQEQPYPHQQPHSHHSSLSQSPLPGSYPHTSEFQTPPYAPGIPMYAQPHPQLGYGYLVGEYSGVSVGQPFPAYWSKTERHPQQVSSYPPSINQALMFGQVEGPRISVESTSGRGRQREVVFGSIGVDSPHPGSSPTLRQAEAHSAEKSDDVDVNGSRSAEGEGPLENEGEKGKTFSIGIAPDAPDLLRLRSRTRSTNTRTRGVNGKMEGGLGNTSSKPGLEVGGEEVKVIDLTDNETRWEFGTTKHPDNEVGVQPEAEQHQQAEYITPQESWSPSEFSYPPSLPNDHLSPPIPALASRVGLSPTTTPPNGLSIDPPNEGPMSTSAVLLGSDSLDSADLTVKNFGWGFGDGALTRDQTIARERDHEVSRQREERAERGEVGQRPTRGSYGSVGYVPFEYKSGYGGRRGRGYGGRGYNPRGYGRGYQQNRQHTQPPFNVTPPTSFQPLPQPQHVDPVNVNGYYSAVQPPMAGYLPGGYETYQPQPMVHVVPVVTPGVGTGMPPVPSPVSQLSFPLDPTRYYLLGQLEYYLSPQNLAQDFYLRKQVSFVRLFRRLILNLCSRWIRGAGYRLKQLHLSVVSRR